MAQYELSNLPDKFENRYREDDLGVLTIVEYFEVDALFLERGVHTSVLDQVQPKVRVVVGHRPARVHVQKTLRFRGAQQLKIVILIRALIS